MRLGEACNIYIGDSLRVPGLRMDLLIMIWTVQRSIENGLFTPFTSRPGWMSSFGKSRSLIV